MPELNSLGITESDYLNWKHHPVSKVVLKYLVDYRQSLLNLHLAEWEAGKIDEVRDLECRGRTLTLLELSDLPFSAIENFYRTEDDNAS